MFTDTMSLDAARELLRALVDEGHRCPCCTQFAKVYKRKINSTMARDLIALYRQAGRDWAYLPDVRKRSGSRSNREESKLRYWSLIQEEPAVRPDGGRSGWWRVTQFGEAFVLGRLTVPKYARIYDDRLLGHLGEEVSIMDALGDRFDYRELMAE
jgi:hypothetical protein